MDVSVVIPTYGRPEKIGACVRALAAQTLDPSRFEVLVGIDGPDEHGSRAAIERVAEGLAVEVVDCPRAGYNAARNVLLERCRGRVMVSLNDDVVADRRLVEVHLAEQVARAELGGAIIVGRSPWRSFPRPTLFDRLVRETSMVFFYDRMDTPEALADPERDWGFRHCWGLNFSAPMRAVREVGGFTAFPLAYGYDDIDLAFRLQRGLGMPVLYRPGALAEHDHRYLPEDVLRRERQLGRAAWQFAGLNAEFTRAVFGRDIRSAEEVAYSRAFVERERGAAGQLRESFLALSDVPEDAVGGPHAALMVRLVYQQHLLLKRWTWRSGLLEAAHGVSGDMPVVARAPVPVARQAG